jgi:hypothetical protein
MCHVTNYVNYVFTKNKLFHKFESNELIKHIIYDMWKPRFKKWYFILFSCALQIEISLKVHNGHKNEELEKNILEQYVCIMNMKNGVKQIITFNKAQGMMNI